MHNYIFLFYLPGSAGNFFSRALSLMSNDHYCYVDKTDKNRFNFRDLDEKFLFLSYDKCNNYNSWIEFERQILPIDPHDRLQLPPGSYFIWAQHPRYNLLTTDIAGIDDTPYVFYIDPSNDFEWCILNALYKNSYIDVQWLKDGQSLLNDPSVYKLSLSNIIKSKETFLTEIEKVATITNFNITPESQNKMFLLWDQWHETTLKKENFNTFKQSIGFNL